MSIRGEFANILEKKMGPTPILEKKAYPIRTDFHQDSHFSMSKINLKTCRFTSLNSDLYPSQPKAKSKITPNSTPQKLPAEENLTSILKLSQKSQKAFFLLEKLGANFEDGKLGVQALKREYRRLAKVFHPDQQTPLSCSKKFHYLHTCYQLLFNELQSHEIQD